MPAASRWSEIVTSIQIERAVLADVALLQRVAGQLAPHQRGVLLEFGRQILGVRDVLERPLEQLVAGVADDLAVLLVDAEAAAVGILVGDADGGVLEGAAEPLLALAQRLLGPPVVGDVDAAADEPNRSALAGRAWPRRA